MEPRKRTHLVNELMQEANLMMAALEKAMEGERSEESHPTLHGTHHVQGQYSLEDEHKAWGQILRALRGYPETLSLHCREIMQHPCGNETQGDCKERVDSA